MKTERHSLGYFGNIWVRMNYLKSAGDRAGGHKHNFDHVSLLCRGKVRVEIDGFEPKEFVAPTFIVIKKEHEHDFVALEDDTLWYCVFALRDVNGEVTDFYDGDNSPYGAAPVGDLNVLDESTVAVVDKSQPV
jgi:hypothetical protein